MTVSSLWKALDRAGCGKSVGAKEIQEHCTFNERLHPWNVNETQKVRPTLAIDLSIWICEALSSSAMGKTHKDPPLYLVYTRVLKLLNLGVKVIVVVEGKKRTRRSDGEDSFRKRRSGTRFWSACQRCEVMLGLLGVPVVRAKAEGEALCALLNQKDIVDGVISNDGDCLLYGAKVLYTKFTLENLEKSRVMRYDISSIRACVDDDDGDQYDNEREPHEIVSLNRNDLIAFAIMTGSDIAGHGIPKVGCRKAIRFIKKCQIDNPLKRQDAAINELRSWANVACARGEAYNEREAETEPEDNRHRRCSCCCHPGTKASHKKLGCKMCGTEAGEPCFTVSPGGKFRSSLRAKALEMTPAFDPESVFAAYHHPNDNQIPLLLHGKSARNLQMTYPKLQEFLQSPLVIRGHSFAESRDYLRQSLSCLLARTELLNGKMEEGDENTSERLPVNRTRPQPKKISKAIVYRGKPCFEVDWIVKATVTDAQGNPIDEFEFSTIEDQTMIEKCYPKLIVEFEEEGREKQRQGTAEQEKRRAFLNLICGVADNNEETKPKSDRRKVSERHFRDAEKLGQGAIPPGDKHPYPIKSTVAKRPQDLEVVFHGDLRKQLQPPPAKRGRVQDLLPSKRTLWGDDADKLLRFVAVRGEMTYKDDCLSSIHTESVCSTIAVERKLASTFDSEYVQSFTPGHLHFLGSKHEPKCEQNSFPPLRFSRAIKPPAVLKEHESYPVEHNLQPMHNCSSSCAPKSDTRPLRASPANCPVQMDAPFAHFNCSKRKRREQSCRRSALQDLRNVRGNESFLHYTNMSEHQELLDNLKIGLSETDYQEIQDTSPYEFIQVNDNIEDAEENVCAKKHRHWQEERQFDNFESKIQEKEDYFNNGFLLGSTKQVEERYNFWDEQTTHQSFKPRSHHAASSNNDYEIDILLREWEKDEDLGFCYRREVDEVPPGILQTATQKLETKIRQASLDFECFQQLGHVNSKALLGITVERR
jgi:hypothetical protein